MAILSEVSKLRAAYHYFTKLQNLLLTAGTACFLGKHLVSLLGKDCTNFPGLEKIGSCTRDYFAFSHFASAMNSAHSLVSIMRDGVAVIKGEGQKDVRARRNGDMPRQDTPYHLGRVEAWMAYKGASAVFKAVSSLLLVHETFKRLGVVSESFSPTVRAVGSGLGALGFVIDIIDTGRAYYEHPKDVTDRAVPTDVKIKDSKGRADVNLHRTHIQESRKFDVAFDILIIGIKVMGLVRAFGVVEGTGLTGRVSQFAADHADNIYGTIFTAMSVTGIVQHARYGATIQQLEKRDVNKG